MVESEALTHTVADISTSGFDGHTATSGCSSMKHSLVYTFFEFGVVENCFFRSRITVILTSDSFGIRLWATTMGFRWRPITTSGFVRHLENVEMPLFIFLHTHVTTVKR